MRILLGLFLFALLLFLPGASSRHFWGNDENRYAVVARHMAEDGGSMALLENHGKPYSDKPPFLFWCVTAASRLGGGLSELTARLPVAVFGAATIVLTFVFGVVAFSARTGLLAAIVLASAGEFFWLSRRLAFDPILAFWVTLAAFSFFIGFERGSRRAHLVAFAAMALATLTKGPIGIVFPLLGLLAFGLACGKEGRSRLRSVPWLAGTLLLAAILACWLVPAALEGGNEFANELLFKQQLDRTTGERGHSKGLLFYFEAFPAGFLPWTPLLLAAPFLARVFRAGPERRGVAYCASFFIAGFVFLSVLKTKRNLYAIPLFPAAALLSAATLDAAFRGAAGRLSPWIASFPAALLAMAGALSLAAAFALPFVLPTVSAGAAALAFPLIAVPALAGFALFLRRRAGALLSLALTALGAGLFAGLVLLPARDASESNAAFSRDLAARLAPGDRVAVYRIQPHEVLYYTGLRRVAEPGDEAALAALRDAPERLFVVVEDKNVAEVKSVLGALGKEILSSAPALGSETASPGFLEAKDKDRLHVFVTRSE